MIHILTLDPRCNLSFIIPINSLWLSWSSLSTSKILKTVFTKCGESFKPVATYTARLNSSKKTRQAHCTHSSYNMVSALLKKNPQLFLMLYWSMYAGMLVSFSISPLVLRETLLSIPVSFTHASVVVYCWCANFRRWTLTAGRGSEWLLSRISSLAGLGWVVIVGVGERLLYWILWIYFIWL